MGQSEAREEGRDKERERHTQREREESGVKISNFFCQIMGTLRSHCNNLDCYSAIKNRGLLEDIEE